MLLKRFHAHRKLAQSTIEYAVLIGVFCAAVLTMFYYTKAGIRGKFKFLADEMQSGMTEEITISCRPISITRCRPIGHFGWSFDCSFCLNDKDVDDWESGNVSMPLDEWLKLVTKCKVHGPFPGWEEGQSYTICYKFLGNSCNLWCFRGRSGCPCTTVNLI